MRNFLLILFVQGIVTICLWCVLAFSCNSFDVVTNANEYLKYISAMIWLVILLKITTEDSNRKWRYC